MNEPRIVENSIQSLDNGWRKATQIQIVPAYRDGWLGVWDSLKAAILHEPRSRVAMEVKFGIYIKAPGDIYIWGAQVEEGKII